MDNCLIYHGVTEDVIRMFGEIEVMNVKAEISRRDVLSNELCRKLANDFAKFSGMAIPEDGETRYHWLEEQMTFMYR